MAELYRGVWVIGYRELVRITRGERGRLIASFAMPLLFLLIFGAGLSRTVGNLTPGVDFGKFVYPGAIGMTVLITSVFAGVSVVWDREFGFLKEVLVAPISRAGIVLGKAAGGAGIALLQTVLLLALAPAVGVTLSATTIAKLIPLILLLSLCLSGLGILVASRMRSQQGFQLVMQLLIAPLTFLSGMFFPVNNVPLWLALVAKLDPVTYGIDAIRRVTLEHALTQASATGTATPLGVSVLGHTLTVLEESVLVGATGLALLAAAIWSFSRTE